MQLVRSALAGLLCTSGLHCCQQLDMRFLTRKGKSRMVSIMTGSRWQSDMRPDGRPQGRGPTGPGWQPPPPPPGSPTSATSNASIGDASIAGPGDGDGDVQGAEAAADPGRGESLADSARRALRRYGNYASKAARRAIELASSSSGEPQTAKVTFWLQFHVEWGQRLRVVGSHPQLGACTCSGNFPVLPQAALAMLCLVSVLCGTGTSCCIPEWVMHQLET